jgi:hypothetical protein
MAQWQHEPGLLHLQVAVLGQHILPLLAVGLAAAWCPKSTDHLLGLSMLQTAMMGAAVH